MVMSDCFKVFIQLLHFQFQVFRIIRMTNQLIRAISFRSSEEISYSSLSKAKQFKIGMEEFASVLNIISEPMNSEKSEQFKVLFSCKELFLRFRWKQNKPNIHAYRINCSDLTLYFSGSPLNTFRISISNHGALQNWSSVVGRLLPHYSRKKGQRHKGDNLLSGMVKRLFFIETLTRRKPLIVMQCFQIKQSSLSDGSSIVHVFVCKH